MSDPQTQQTPAQATPNEAEDTPQDEAANTAENEANRLMFENAFTSRFSFSPQERRRMQELLRQKLPISMISTRMGPGGQKLAYLEGHRVIDLANDIFSPFNWSSSVSDLSLDYMERSSGYFCVGVTALVKVTLRDGTYHEDVGFGDARMRSRGDSIKWDKRGLPLHLQWMNHMQRKRAFLHRARSSSSHGHTRQSPTVPHPPRLQSQQPEHLQQRDRRPVRAVVQATLPLTPMMTRHSKRRRRPPLQNRESSSSTHHRSQTKVR
ncbi:MAG: hypothetical protein MHM6MM_005039 [Cercozoa sp. M6MM]